MRFQSLFLYSIAVTLDKSCHREPQFLHLQNAGDAASEMRLRVVGGWSETVLELII